MGKRTLIFLALSLSACTHQITPVVSVAPPGVQTVDASVVLILTEELEAYESNQKNGIHTFFFQFGKATADGMITVFQNVFSDVRVERGLGPAAAMAMVARSESLDVDYLAVPRVQSRGSTGALDTDIAVDVVVDLINLETGESTLLSGSGKEGFTMSATGSAETALEDALQEIQAQLIKYSTQGG